MEDGTVLTTSPLHIKKMNLFLQTFEQQRGAEEARWAHNSDVARSKLAVAKFLSFLEN